MKLKWNIYECESNVRNTPMASAQAIVTFLESRANRKTANTKSTSMATFQALIRSFKKKYYQLKFNLSVKRFQFSWSILITLITVHGRSWFRVCHVLNKVTLAYLFGFENKFYHNDTASS